MKMLVLDFMVLTSYKIFEIQMLNKIVIIMVKLQFQQSFFLIYEALQINIVYQQSNIISSKDSFASQGLRNVLRINNIVAWSLNQCV